MTIKVHRVTEEFIAERSDISSDMFEWVPSDAAVQLAVEKAEGEYGTFFVKFHLNLDRSEAEQLLKELKEALK